jgi:acylphosphatase
LSNYILPAFRPADDLRRNCLWAKKSGEINHPVEKSRVHLLIAGRVQGVFFRASTVHQAQNLGLTGWVMNCPDGSVEAVAEGAAEKLEEFIAWCHKGPAGAQVDRVAVKWQVARGSFREFFIKR